MAIKLSDGNYVPDDRGGQMTVGGVEATLQRILMKLKARRGGFPLMPEFGSRLYLLVREKPSARQRAAEQYINEALADETDTEVAEVTVGEDGDGITVAVRLIIDGGQVPVSIRV